MTTVAKVTLRHLQQTKEDLSELIEQARDLGCIVVTDIPQLVTMRSRLLSLAQHFAALPREVQQQYEDPDSSFSYGWSHGRETFNGSPDMNKGSFYGNPLSDEAVDAALQSRFPSLCGSNIWPHQHLPDLEYAFKDLGRLIIEVGLLVTEQLDAYLEAHWVKADNTAGSAAGSSDETGCDVSNLPYRKGVLGRTIAESPNPKGRLLHYFPPHGAGSAEYRTGNWCGWHKDHGSLTGLTAGMYFKDGCQVDPPDSHAGLYIKSREGTEVKVVITGDQLLFQFGEVIQVESGGIFSATPHYVRAPQASPATEGVSRANFAVFMQPSYEAVVKLPPWVTADSIGVDRWQPGMTFGEFSEAVIGDNYG